MHVDVLNGVNLDVLGWRDPAITGLFVRQHKNIIAKIAEYMSGGDLKLRTMQVSLMNLESFLAT